MKSIVGTTPIPLLGRIGQGRPLVQNLGPGKVYFDTDADVSVETGFELGVGAAFEFAEDSNVTPSVYVVADTADTELRIVNF